MTLQNLLVSSECKANGDGCSQTEWSARACNFLATQNTETWSQKDLSLCGLTFIPDNAVLGSGNNDGTGNINNIPNTVPTTGNEQGDFASLVPSHKDTIGIWHLVQLYDVCFNEMVRIFDEHFTEPHYHDPTTGNANKDGTIFPLPEKYQHKHVDNDKKVDFNRGNYTGDEYLGGLVTPHTHNINFPYSSGLTGGGKYPKTGFTDIPSGIEYDNKTYWKTVEGSADYGLNNGKTLQQYITDLEGIITEIQNRTELMKINNAENIIATTDTSQTSTYLKDIMCLDSNNFERDCTEVKGFESSENKRLFDEAAAAKMGAKNKNMLYSLNISATINLAFGIVILLFLIFKMFKLPNPINKMKEAASSAQKTASETGKKAADATKKTVEKAKDSAKEAAAKGTKLGEKGLKQMNNLAKAATTKPSASKPPTKK